MGNGIEPRIPFAGLGIAASGMAAQRARMDAVAMNVANAETTRTAQGGAYRRQVVLLQEIPFANSLDEGEAAEGDPGLGGVRVTGVQEDASEGPLVYDPGHPDADEKGYVRMPNVNVPGEMADLMDARNLFEANASVFLALRNMLHRASQL